MVRLMEGDLQAELFGLGLAGLPDLRKRRRAVDMRLPHPQEIEIGTVQDHHSLHGAPFLKNYPPNHFAGPVTSTGNSVNKASTTSCAIMNGQTPRIKSSMLTRETPQTTLSTTPTGGLQADRIVDDEQHAEIDRVDADLLHDRHQ